jgi:MFS family permease
VVASNIVQHGKLMTNALESSSQTMDLKSAGRAALLLSGILSSFAQGGLDPILPAIATHFSDYPRAGLLSRLLVSLIGAMIVIGSPFMGALADRYGRRRLLLSGMLLYGVAGCSGFVVNNLYVLVVTRVFVGLGTAAVGAVMLAIVVTHSSGPARNRWLGYINSVGVLMVVLLFPIVGLLGHYGWRWPFLLHGIAFVLIVLVLFGIDADHGTATPKSKGTRGRKFKELHWKLLLISAAGGSLLVTPTFYFPFHLREVGIGDPRLISAAFVPNILCAGGSALLYGRVRTYLSLQGAFVLGFVLSGLGLTTGALGQNYALVTIGMILAGCSVGLIATNIYALAALTGSDSNRAEIMGLTKAAMFCGPLVGQLLLEPVVKKSNSGTALLLLGGFAFLMLTITIFRPRVAISPTVEG